LACEQRPQATEQAGLPLGCTKLLDDIVDPNHGHAQAPISGNQANSAITIIWCSAQYSSLRSY
jgi:hypothetical protein